MSRKVSFAAAVVALVAAVTIPVASAAPAQLSAELTGAAEVPGPGDPNGKGAVFMAVKKARNRICYALGFKRIGEPTAAHIHKGARDEAGPVKVVLFEDPTGLPVPGEVDDCIGGLGDRLVDRLAEHPRRFYVNVHNDRYPDGAIRGQLGPAL